MPGGPLSLFVIPAVRSESRDQEHRALRAYASLPWSKDDVVRMTRAAHKNVIPVKGRDPSKFRQSRSTALGQIPAKAGMTIAVRSQRFASFNVLTQ